MPMLRRLVARIGILTVAAIVGGCGSTPEVEKKEMLPSGVRRPSGSVFVSPSARDRIYRLVAVTTFRAPIELAGASISDLFATELSKTYKYRLVERSQMEQVLGEQALGLKGVTEGMLVAQLGKMLGVQGVIVGTVPEYGSKASGATELAAVGINIRMIDVSDGSIVWSISDSAISDRPVSLSAFSARMVENMVASLVEEWRQAGDIRSANLPEPQLISAEGLIRGAVLELRADGRDVTAFVVERSQSEGGPYKEVGKLSASGQIVRFEDKGLLDAETYFYRASTVARSGFISTPAGPFKVTTVGPPPTVTGLKAVSGLIRKIELSWDPSLDPNTAGYLVQRKPEGGSWEKALTVSGRQSTTAVDEKLKDGKAYSYRVVAFNSVQTQSPPSGSVSATTKGPPAPVPSLRAAGSQPRKVTLDWEPVAEPEVKGYAVSRAQAQEGPFKQIAFVKGRDSSSFVDLGKKSQASTGEGDEDAPARSTAAGTGGLLDNTRYFYKVHAVNVVDVAGGDSPIASAVTKPIPDAVMRVTPSQDEVRQVRVSWAPNREPDIARYEVLRGEKPGDTKKRVAMVDAPETQAVDGDLKAGATFFYRVRAIDRDGLVGTPSEPVEGRTKPLPSAPQRLQATLQEGSVSLSWEAAPEPDVVKYLVHRKAFFGWDALGEIAAPPYDFRGEMKPGKTITFRVVAVDAADQQSAPSGEASVNIP